VVLIAIGLVYGYFSGVHMEHTVTTVNIISVIATYLKDIAIAVVFVMAGGLMVIFGIKKS
jgi:hypothetical protein